MSVAVAAGVGACVPDTPQRSTWVPFLEGRACLGRIAQTLSEWGATADALPAPPRPGAVSTHKLATGRIGEWVLLDALADGGSRITRISDDGVRERRVSEACVVEDDARAAEPPGRGAFSDRVLRDLIAATPQGLLVYVWAPHMPLSVDGYREAQAAAGALGLGVVPVLFAGSDPDFARREARRAGIPEEGLREMASVELILRDAQVHAPSLLVFAEDRVSPVLPGYRNAEGYARFVRGVLAAGGR